MIKMIQLKQKDGNLHASEIQAQKLFNILTERGMPADSLNLFSRQLEKGKPIDGATLYAEFANIIFTPFTITWEEAKERQMIVLTG